MKKRDGFNSKLGFILAVVGSAVGLGNIWRYPYVLYSNGGGAFLIPYFVAILTAGIPLVMLEYGLGHKFRLSTPLAFEKAKKSTEWLGWIPSITAFVILTFYSAILGWAINYLFFSFDMSFSVDTNAFFFKEFLNVTKEFDFSNISILGIIGITIIWGLNWLINFLGVSKGIEKLNKVLIPLLLILIVIIVIKGLTLEGSIDGLNKLLTPKWSALMDINVWLSAFGQVFFSLSLAMGILTVYSSYLPKKTDINNSAFITAFANCGFEFFVSIGVFSILGYMANVQGVPIENVVDQGIGLAFVVFPKVFSIMGLWGKILSILFFLSLIFAGLTSSVSLLEATTAAITDKTGFNRKKVSNVISFIGFLISLTFATGGGLIHLDIMDYYINSFILVGGGLVEAIIVGWFYGAKNLREYNNSISIIKVGVWWDYTIKYIIPLALGYILFSAIFKEMNKGYGGYSNLALSVFGLGTIIIIIITSIILSRRKS